MASHDRADPLSDLGVSDLDAERLAGNRSRDCQLTD